MRRVSTRSRLWPLLAVSLIGLGVVSVTSLAASSASSTIYACQTTKGAIHIVTSKAKCKRGEKKLSWNASGPSGPTGPQGTPGAAGAAAPALGGAFEALRAEGPLKVLHASETFPPTPATTVATLSGLPAGSYDIRATTNINAPEHEDHSIACTLTAGSDTNIGETESHLEFDAGLNISTQLLHTFAGTGSATLACASEGNNPLDTWSARNTSIIAVPVGGVNVTQVSG